ncbi:hypothetical protein SAMN05444273_10956 [Litoreibacter ascidiaceicola]|uniref:Uncharacterized protein n=1 Tax=Litoreibacter ascidiaceicola TaxID=1486859 RepID=A0A1M5DIG1_9RHOB|nr:hypothetical protein SAMN05444273_10956 [Litoreibacter ascidiaceicola]
MIRKPSFATKTLAMASLAFPPIAHANPQIFVFNQSWKEQGFSRFLSNEYCLHGRQLDIVFDGTVSVPC